MKHRKILITGGSGFLGTHLTELLVRNNYQIMIIDRATPKIKNVQFLQTDFISSTKIMPYVKKADAVIHLAALVGVDNCRLQPKEVMKVNYLDIKTFVDLCLKTGIKKFIFSSSSEVYGNNKVIPYKENSILSPLSDYGKAKVMSEKYLKSVSKKNPGMSFGIIRLFNLYGPYQSPNFVIPRFINMAINNKPITIFGTGRQIRCFTYVKDAAEAIKKFLEYDKSRYEIINIGRSEETTIKELAEKILECIPQSESEIKYIPYGKNGVRSERLEIERRVPDVEKAKRLLNFEASTNLKQGILKQLSISANSRIINTSC